MLLDRAPAQFETGSPATSVYYRGQCTLLVNTDATELELRPDLQRLTSKEDVLFFITAHEIAHCVSHHPQAQELKRLASGQALTNTFLPGEVLERGSAGTLNQASFAAILKSPTTAKREETFADGLASLYCRIKKRNAEDILRVIELRVPRPWSVAMKLTIPPQ